MGVNCKHMTTVIQSRFKNPLRDQNKLFRGESVKLSGNATLTKTDTEIPPFINPLRDQNKLFRGESVKLSGNATLTKTDTEIPPFIVASPQEAALMTSLCMMFLFQNGIDSSDELGSEISRYKYWRRPGEAI
ncbi:uncharacterized [Tachysurus ichikawai]